MSLLVDFRSALFFYPLFTWRLQNLPLSLILRPRRTSQSESIFQERSLFPLLGRTRASFPHDLGYYALVIGPDENRGKHEWTSVTRRITCSKRNDEINQANRPFSTDHRTGSPIEAPSRLSIVASLACDPVKE